MEAARTITGSFTLTDLRARCDDENMPSIWLADWKGKGWVETIRPMTYRKTAKFPKVT